MPTPIFESDLYFEPVEFRWPRVRDLVADLGCKIVRAHPGRTKIGDSPGYAQLLDDHVIEVPPGRISVQTWAHVAHEAMHDHVGLWSLDYEQPMLPFELEIYRRIASDTERRACYRYFSRTVLDEDIYAMDLIAEHGPRWRVSELWSGFRWECRANGLPLDGRLRNEDPRP